MILISKVPVYPLSCKCKTALNFLFLFADNSLEQNPGYISKAVEAFNFASWSSLGNKTCHFQRTLTHHIYDVSVIENI